MLKPRTPGEVFRMLRTDPINSQFQFQLIDRGWIRIALAVESFTLFAVYIIPPEEGREPRVDWALSGHFDPVTTQTFVSMLQAALRGCDLFRGIGADETLAATAEAVRVAIRGNNGQGEDVGRDA